MKRIIISAIAAFASALILNVNAQYIHRDKSSFVYDNGVKLSDRELIDIVGMDTFTETIVGARKQYDVGGKLIAGGLIALGTGILFSALEWYDTDFGALTTIVLFYGGGAAADTGTVLRIIGKSRLDWVEGYANTKHYTVIGSTPNGFGVSIHF